jgi:DNA topoisomerase-6 subunit B
MAARSVRKKTARKHKPAPSPRAKRTPAKTSARKKAGNGKARKQRPAPAQHADATDQAKKQREISVSEFFAKNRHLLGFDNPSKALRTTVKEGVDNSLDACEEAGILPEIRVEIEQLLSMGVRAEQQSLAMWGLNYVIEEYLPAKLRNPRAFLP